MAATTANKQSVLSIYRNLTRLIKALPPKQKPDHHLSELRSTFNKHASLTDPIEIQERIKEAGEKIAYLRIMTPKRFLKSNTLNDGDDEDASNSSSSSSSSNGTKRWVYTKDGKIEIDGSNKARGGGRVHSNWDGKNLDPCAVKTHNGQLRRMGFQNNLHAKGLF